MSKRIYKGSAKLADVTNGTFTNEELTFLFASRAAANARRAYDQAQSVASAAREYMDRCNGKIQVAAVNAFGSCI